MDNVLFATDMDEVLVNISPTWFFEMKKNREVFDPYFDLDKITNPNDMLNRDIYYIEKYLKRPEVETIPDEVMNKYYDIYTNEDFYSKCSLTKFGQSLVLLSKQRFCEKIVIVSHCIPGTEEPKIKWISNKFEGSNKVVLEFIPSNIKKSEVLKNYKYTSYADDRIDIIKEVIMNTDSEGKEFLIPELGYNKIDDVLIALAKAKNCHLKNFKPF